VCVCVCVLGATGAALGKLRAGRDVELPGKDSQKYFPKYRLASKYARLLTFTFFFSAADGKVIRAGDVLGDPPTRRAVCVLQGEFVGWLGQWVGWVGEC
jgi:hypothetical protein